MAMLNVIGARGACGYPPGDEPRVTEQDFSHGRVNKTSWPVTREGSPAGESYSAALRHRTMELERSGKAGPRSKANNIVSDGAKQKASEGRIVLKTCMHYLGGMRNEFR